MLLSRVKFRAPGLAVVTILFLGLGTFGYFAFSNDTEATPNAQGNAQPEPLLSMVERPPVISPNADKRIVRFVVQPGGKFHFDARTGTLPEKEINKLREQIDKADIGNVSVDDGPTLTFRWRDEAGKQR